MEKYKGRGGFRGGVKPTLPEDQKKSRQVALRMTENQYKLIKEKSEVENKTISAYILSKILK